MAELRDCAQCGAAFEPRREHAGFCSAACRISWNRAHTRGQLVGDTALSWSVGTMNDTVQRLSKVTGIDVPEALALISESVWWVTLVDASMIRYHEAVYDDTLIRLSPADRHATEGILTGLRFVRNWMGYYADPADFIQPVHESGGSDAPLAAWRWNPLPVVDLGAISPRGRRSDKARYQEYGVHLACKPVGETITRAVAFLNDLTPSQAFVRMD